MEEERHARWGKEWRDVAEGVESNEDVRARGLSALKEWQHEHAGPEFARHFAWKLSRATIGRTLFGA